MMMPETLGKSCSNKESNSSSRRRNNRWREERRSSEVHIECQETEQRSSSNSKADMRPGSVSHSPIIKSRGRGDKLCTQDKDDDDDLIILTPEHVDISGDQITETVSEDTPVVIKETSRSDRRGWHERIVRNTNTTPPNLTTNTNKTISTTAKKRKAAPITITSTTTTTTTIVMPSDEESDPDIVPSSQNVRQTNINPRVLIVPLVHSDAAPKRPILSSMNDLTPNERRTPTKRSVVTNIVNGSQTSPVIGSSHLFQNVSAALQRTSLTSSEHSNALSPSKAASIHNVTKNLNTTPRLSKGLGSTSIRRNLSTSLAEDSKVSRNCVSPSGTSEVIYIPVISSTTTTTTTTTATSTTTSIPSLVTSTTTSATPSHKDVQPVIDSDSDLEVEISVSRLVYHPINVLSSKSDNGQPLKRKRPLLSELSDKAFHRGSKESVEKCRKRIHKLMDDTFLRLEKHQSHLTPIKESPPIIVDRKLYYPIKRQKPAYHQKQKVQQVEEVDREECDQRLTQQTTRCSQGTSEPIASSSNCNKTTRVQKLEQERSLVHRRSKTINIPPHSKETTDSDSDDEISFSSQSYCSQSVKNTLKPESTVINPQTEAKKQSQIHRKFVESRFEDSDKECLVENRSGNCSSSKQGNIAAGSESNRSEVCIIDDGQVRSSLTLPPLTRLSHQGIKRPSPGSSESTQRKQRKIHAITQENSSKNSPSEDTIQQTSNSPDCTPSRQDHDEPRRTKIRLNQKEEEGNKKGNVKKTPSPLYQRLHSTQQIEQRAPHCRDMRQNQRHQHKHTPANDHRGSRRDNYEPAAPVVSSSDARGSYRNRRLWCRFCRETFLHSEDLRHHMESYHNQDQDAYSIPSSSSSSFSYITTKTYKRKDGVRIHVRQKGDKREWRYGFKKWFSFY